MFIVRYTEYLNALQYCNFCIFFMWLYWFFRPKHITESCKFLELS